MCSDINPWQRIKTQAHKSSPKNSKTWIPYKSTENISFSALQWASTHANEGKVPPSLKTFSFFHLIYFAHNRCPNRDMDWKNLCCLSRDREMFAILSLVDRWNNWNKLQLPNSQKSYLPINMISLVPFIVFCQIPYRLDSGKHKITFLLPEHSLHSCQTGELPSFWLLHVWKMKLFQKQ